MGVKEAAAVPIEIEIDEGRQRVSLWASGVLTDADVLETVSKLQAQPDAIHGFDLLADLSGTERFEVSTSAVRSLSMEGVVTGDGSRRAIVAHSAVAYGVGRMYAMLRGDPLGKLAVFRTRAEAVAWLEHADRQHGSAV